MAIALLVVTLEHIALHLLGRSFEIAPGRHIVEVDLPLLPRLPRPLPRPSRPWPLLESEAAPVMVLIVDPLVIVLLLIGKPSLNYSKLAM